MLLDVICFSFLVALIRGGRIKEFPKFQKIYLLVITIGLQVCAVFFPLIGGIFISIAYLFILAFLVFNREFEDIRIFMVGWFLNSLAIWTNGGKMPIDPVQARKLPYNFEEVVNGTNFKHSVLTESTNLPFLTDVIYMPSIIPRVISIGDIFIMLGAFLLVQRLMNKPISLIRLREGKSYAAKNKIGFYIKGIIVQIGFVVAAISIFYSSLSQWEPREHWGVLFIYTLLTIFSCFTPVRNANTIMTVNNAVIFSGILLYGVWVGVWTAVIEAIIIATLVRINPLKALMNIGQLLMTIWTVAYLNTLLKSVDFLSPLISDLILTVVYWFVNLVLVGLAISYFQNKGWVRTVIAISKGFTSTYLLLLILAGVGSRLVEYYGVIALVPMVIAFLTISFVFHHYYDNVVKLQQKVEEVKRFNHNFLTTMAASIDARDRYTSGHSLRVAYWGREIAKQIGLSSEKVDEVYFGGILHDIGKIGIEDEILNKKGRLTPEEYDKIKQHTVIGYEIIKQAGMFHELLPAIRSHHERVDGKGYPDGLVGNEIPLIARILAVSDAFDAMVADRPYRKGLPIDQALQEIRRGAGTQFDEELASHFIVVINSLPREELEKIIRQNGQEHKPFQDAFH